jgi:muconate cycloisomerase
MDTPVDLNGRQLVTSQYAGTTVQVRDGAAYVPDRPGLGVDVDEEWVRAQSSQKSGG